MLDGLSKSVALYLAPLLALTGFILSMLAFLAPTVVLHTQVALINVAVKASDDDANADGPRVWMGAIGSCARSNNGAEIFCTPPSITSNYGEHILDATFFDKS
jgi:hypothetical protein